MNLHGDALNRFTLKTGIEVEILELRQSLTYEGHLEGLPTRETNQRHIDGLVEGLMKSALPHGTQPGVVVILPVQTPIPMPEGERYPFGTPSRLPSVTCIARLGSSTTRDPDMDYSRLTVIWFQETFAFPVAEEIAAELQRLNWNRVATDYEF